MICVQVWANCGHGGETRSLLRRPRAGGSVANMKPVRVAGILAACVLVTLLSGCIAQSSLSGRMVDGQLEIVFCAGYSGDGLGISEVTKDKHTATDLWLADGDVSFDERATLKYGETPDGMTNTLGPSTLDPSDRYIDFHLTDGENLSASGHFDGDKLADGGWLSSNSTPLIFGPCGIF